LSITSKLSVFLEDTGMLTRFSVRFFTEGFRPRYEIGEFLRQCYLVGNKSFTLVSLTAFILGLVFTIQLRPAMIRYGAVAQIPYIVSNSIIKEIGPIVIALIFAGKVGSGIGAELGSMKVTEQIDAMEVSGTNPFKYLVVTRVFATTLMLPLLVILADTISLFGSFLGSNIQDVMSFNRYFDHVFVNLSYQVLLPAIIKTFFFGFAVGIVGCYFGFHSSKGTEGVGRSANSSVVISSLLIFLIDLIAVQITDLLGYN
jgi:phospholipid/cholesterol/gamma-HCH transport system permease protein